MSMIVGKIEEAEDFINLGVVINSKKEVLMIRRAKKEIGKNGSVLCWAFPGGKQHLNESRGDCVKREILDETGYSVKAIRQISLRKHPEFPVMIVYHLCELEKAEQIAKPKEPYEVAEIRWVKPAEIKGLVTSEVDPTVSRTLRI